MNKVYAAHAIATGFLVGLTMGALINGWGNPLSIAIMGIVGAAVNILMFLGAFHAD
jgi:hypothetical protein